MSFRAKVAIFVDMSLGIALLLLYLTRVHLTVGTSGVSAMVPAYWLYSIAIVVAGATTTWWLIGRQSR